MAKNLLHELQSNRPFLSGVEQKIADVILSDPRTFVTYSMKELSELADISQGSIMNFSNKFAGGGYPTLKLRVMEGLAEFERPFSVIEETDDLKRVLQKTADGCMQALTNTMNVNDEDTIRRVTDRILQANKVEICGIFQSALVGTSLYYQLLKLGIPASFVGDVLTCAISASMLDQDSLLIAVSSSGKTKDVIDAVKAARAKGAMVVCLTANANSPLAQMSDEVLTASCSGNSEWERPSEIHFSELYLIDIITSCLRQKMADRVETHYGEVYKILTSHNVHD